jgi:beta-lactamase regulating signal transducer with metallopeptidase domain
MNMSEGLFDLLVGLLVRSSLLLAAGGMASILLTRRSASTQAFVLTMVLAGCLALPAAMAMGPAVEVPIPALQVAAATSTSDGSPRPIAGAADPVSESLARAPMPAISYHLADASGSQVPAGRVVPALPLSTWAGLIWLAGTVAIGARLVLGHIGLRRLVRRTRPTLDESWTPLVRRVCTELRLGRRVAVRVSPELSVPIVAGLIRPTVVLPEEAEDWPVAFRRDVLRHELAHAARRDAVGQLAGRLACAAYWFNPLVWTIAARASTMRERACDDAVLEAGSRASEYASRLLALVCLEAGRSSPPAALAIATPSRLHQRIVRVLDPSTRRGRLGRVAGAGTACLALILVAAVGVVRPVGVAAADGAGDVAGDVGRGFSPGEEDRSAGSDRLRQGYGESARAIAKAEGPAYVDGPAYVAKQAPASTICSGRLRRSSSSTNDDDGVRRWRVQLEGDTCDIDLRVDGRIEFNADFTDVASLDQAGQFRLDATTDGVRRYLEIRSRGGTLERIYRVDGRDQAWDAAARDWFAQFLIALDRRTAVGVDVRLPHLLQQGGAGAVFAETALMPSDHARTKYYSRLLDSTTVSAAERRQLIEQAAQLTDSDHYASEVITRVVRQGRLQDPGERDAVVAMIRRMDSDHYRAEAVKALGGGPLTSEQAAAILDVLSSMDSDHYRHQVLTALVAAAPAEVDLTMAASVIRQMDSDHYQAESVKELSRRRPGGIQVSALLPLVGEMDSDHYQREVLRELLRERLPEADLLTAVGLIDGMDSDHYQAEALQDVLRNGGATDRVREAVRASANSLSRHYRQQVLNRIGG